MKSKLTWFILVVFFSSLLLVSGCSCDEEESIEPAPPVAETEPAATTPTEETPPIIEPEPAPAPEVKESPPLEESEPEPREIERETKNKSFIWEITSDVSSVYLLGSIHVASPELYPLDSTIEEAFAIADNLVVEVDMKKVDETESAQLLMDYGTYPQGETLQDNIPADLYTELDALFDKWGIDITMLDMFKPWAVNTMLEEMQMQELGYSPIYGLDLYFIGRAVKEGKDIIELETAEFQFELLNSFSDELMIMILEENVEDPFTQEAADKLFETWENGDVAGMESFVFERLIEEPALAPYYEGALDLRNINMAEKIEEFLADDEIYFIVVGASHLVGEKGLVNILDERGYLTEQLYDSD